MAALAVLVATLWMPVLRIYGSSMAPTLSDGQLVVAIKTKTFAPGDITAFYYGNKLLIKRYIAGPADWVDIDADGIVSINGNVLDEPYLTAHAYGETTITLTTGTSRSTRAARLWAAWRRIRSWEGSFSGSGRCQTSARYGDGR